MSDTPTTKVLQVEVIRPTFGTVLIRVDDSFDPRRVTTEMIRKAIDEQEHEIQWDAHTDYDWNSIDPFEDNPEHYTVTDFSTPPAPPAPEPDIPGQALLFEGVGG